MSGDAASFEARAQVLYDADKLYIGFVVADDYLKSSFEHTDDHLWEQDTVEVMLDPDGDALNYFELQVSPRGVHFDTRYDSARDPRPFGHVDWSSAVKAGVSVQGTLDKDKVKDPKKLKPDGRARVPWSAFSDRRATRSRQRLPATPGA